MKLLKVFGIVVGIHLFALILIFANPGCSSTTPPPPASETIVKNEPPAAAIAVTSATASDTSAAAPGGFDPNAAAISISPNIRYSPTRPNTPAASALEAQPVADVTPASTYTVGKGDSLWSIAKKNHLTISDLAAANNLKAGASVHAGQKLIIPGKAYSPLTAAPKSADPAAASPTPALASGPAPGGSADAVRHTVKAGETLGAIARKYQVKVGDIATVNNIADPTKIRPGQELVIPGWQTPTTKSAKTKAAAAPAAVPTISVGEPERARPASEAPIISVEESPAPGK